MQWASTWLCSTRLRISLPLPSLRGYTAAESIRRKHFQVLLLKHEEIKLSDLDANPPPNPNRMKFVINLRIRIVYLDLCNSFLFKEPKRFSSMDLDLQIYTLTSWCVCPTGHLGSTPACLGWSAGMAAEVYDIQILCGWHAHLQLMAPPVDASNTQILLYSPKYIDYWWNTPTLKHCSAVYTRDQD